ncbi:hypothetical protein ABKW28_00075 [Nocardioides sp. 31GB23]|uniref:hypothetical protein n=1 Tax=Nocardioides sp. 31GB23 TaxID=3156065 RepID=UPI0032AFFC78
MSPHPDSRAVAERAMADLTNVLTRTSDHRVLNVQCRHAHHLAAVYDTPRGLVYRATTGPHAHGSKDYVDTAHDGAGHRRRFTDLLEPGPLVVDEVPAWCDCGLWSLSRADLLARTRDGGGTVHLP